MGAQRETTTLLCVEDDDSLRRALTRRLVAEGFAVVAVGSGAEALAAASETIFDVGVFDVDLVKVSGVFLARRLLILRRVRRAVFFTATATPFELERARRHGVVIHKSEGVTALIAALRRDASPSATPSTATASSKPTAPETTAPEE